MNTTRGRVLGIITGCALSLGLTACVGYVQGDAGSVEVSEPDMYLWGGYGGGYHGDYARRGQRGRRGG